MDKAIFNNKWFVLGVGLTIIGILGSYIGIVFLASKMEIANMFLGARFIFGMAVSELDAAKVGIVAILGWISLFYGAKVFIGGATLCLTQFAKRDILTKEVRS
ncbi:MAG: hypothetical protein WAQ98_13565 [Blastocatellia bacterium]